MLAVCCELFMLTTPVSNHSPVVTMKYKLKEVSDGILQKWKIKEQCVAYISRNSFFNSLSSIENIINELKLQPTSRLLGKCK